MSGACKERIFVLFNPVPKISDQKRAERRQQILNAAWTCFQREGLHATTMDDIIRQAGLSAGAVYSYFKNKDELILAAVTTSLSGLSAQVVPLFAREKPPRPEDLVREILQAVESFTARDGFDLKRIALLGWGEAQRNEKLRGLMRGSYQMFRGQIAASVQAWQRDGVVDAAAKADDVAKTLLALIFGYVVEAAVMGDMKPDYIASGLRGISTSRAAG
jgi:TetR/AcrR family transcriptional regulator, transcriptional repressor of aconitase